MLSCPESDWWRVKYSRTPSAYRHKYPIKPNGNSSSCNFIQSDLPDTPLPGHQVTYFHLMMRGDHFPSREVTYPGLMQRLTERNYSPASSIQQLQPLKVSGRGTRVPQMKCKAANVFPNYEMSGKVTGKLQLWLNPKRCHWRPSHWYVWDGHINGKHWFGDPQKWSLAKYLMLDDSSAIINFNHRDETSMVYWLKSLSRLKPLLHVHDCNQSPVCNLTSKSAVH